MKKTLLLLAGLLLMWSCKAQDLYIIVPLEDIVSFKEAHDGIPKGVYLKDVNHVLDKYVGEWTATYDDRSYKFYITKKIGATFLSGIKYDELLIRYTIFDASGNELANTTNLPDGDISVINGIMFEDVEAKVYSIYYSGEQSICGDSGVLYLEMTNASDTEMSLFIDPDEALFTSADCPNGYVAPPFPQEDEPAMILTKVE